MTPRGARTRRAARAAARRLRDDAGSLWPGTIALLVGIVLVAGFLLRLGSAAVLKDNAQTAADAAALAGVKEGGRGEADRIARANDAVIVAYGGGDPLLVTVETVRTVFGREFRGRASAAATLAPVPPGELGEGREGQPVRLADVAPVPPPCGLSRAELQRFAAETEGGIDGVDLARAREFLSLRGFDVRGGRVGCSAANGRDSLAALANRFGSFGFGVRYLDGNPPAISLTSGAGDGIGAVAPLPGREEARLVPIQANQGG